MAGGHPAREAPSHLGSPPLAGHQVIGAGSQGHGSRVLAPVPVASEESVQATAKERAMRRSVAALAAAAAAICLGVAGGGSAAPALRAGVFTGYGFESCNAPSPAALTAWLASPYRAIGIYIGGVNRTCANAALT